MFAERDNQPSERDYHRPAPTYQPQGQMRGRGRGYRGQPVAPGLTGGPGYVNNTGSRNWAPRNPRPMTDTVAAPGATAMAAMPMTAAPGASPAPPMPQAMASMHGQAQMTFQPGPQQQLPPQQLPPQQTPQQNWGTPHPMTESGQNAYPYPCDDMWAPHLEYEDAANYEAPYSGAYSFYQQGFH